MAAGDFKIPEGYIEDADRYLVLANDVTVPVFIGGRIMLNLVVREQMTINNIIATTGLEGNVCMIIVDYTWKEVVEKFKTAKNHIEKWADDQARKEYGMIKDENNSN